MAAADPRFPRGSVLVKKKYYTDGSTPPREGDAPSLYTVMIKREPGYNPDCGDWEFAVVAGDGREVQARGRLESCMACHESRAQSDFVFRGYLVRAAR
jgi:hypothetical protein